MTDDLVGDAAVSPGRVLHEPATPHQCAPGVTSGIVTEEGDALPVGLSYLIPPTRWSHPPGTLWECECGRVWRAYRPTDADASGQVGRIWWHRVSWLGLWWMRRKWNGRHG